MTTPLTITYPADLPVSQRRDDIADAIRTSQVVIVAGATGSGKTTQLPKILLELGYTSIGHTQPRRIAARTIAERIAEELGQEVGDLVGYQVRFTDRVGSSTRIKLMTDGILLNEIHRDRLLTKYDAIIIDEAHERSLTIDFLLGYLKELLPRRPELRVIITSATIDPESFAAHFCDSAGTPAPIVEVSGRTYPVEIRYRPLVADTSDEADDAGEVDAEPTDLFDAIIAGIGELQREGPGDILVFLSGEAEIRDAQEAITAKLGDGPHGVDVLPLFGRLSAADQHRVFQPGSGSRLRRRVVLATNVAETSLTVPGITYVIDVGTARISRYSTRAKIQRLPIEPVSQASANQRSGRSGRTSPGIAIRLYSEADFTARPEFTEPEILRTNLAAVILQMIALGLGDIAAFPFLQPPDSRGIKDGLDLLRELGAITAGADKQPAVTRVGKQLSRLPLDPRLARMVIESKKYGTTREVMAIVAGLSIQDPRERPLEKRPQADTAHARFTDPTSDFLTLLNLWNYVKEKEQELSSGQFRRLCKAEFLNYLRLREWADVYRQLERQTSSLGLTVGGPAVNPTGIHRSLLAGLLSQLGIRDLTADKKQKNKQGDYIGARSVRFTIFPGSALAKKQPAELMTAELVETSRLFARMNAAIDLSWAESIAGDLVKRSYGEPHWEKKQGSAVAYEKVTLYGVPIVERRRIQFARIDPAYARELFIRHALMDGEWDLHRTDKRLSAFDRANRELRARLEETEERTRKREVRVDDEAIFEFYHRRLPHTVATTRDFETWWKKAHTETPDLLTMSAEDMLSDEQPAASPALLESDYPSWWDQGEQRFAVTYRFEPGADDDGVTVMVPVAALAGLTPTGFDWQVPGLRTELVTALIKTLPKAIRRNVVPAADWASRLLAELPPDAPDEVPLTEYLATQIRRLTYTPVDASDFDLSRVPTHLRINFAVVNERGTVVARSPELAALQHKLKSRARETVARVASRGSSALPGRAVVSTLERDGLTDWTFGDLPQVIETAHGTTTVRAFPALVDAGTTVSIRLFATASDQKTAMRAGLRRLIQLQVPSPASYVQSHLTGAEKLSLSHSPYASTAALFDDCVLACIDAVLFPAASGPGQPVSSHLGDVWSRASFEDARDRVSRTITDDLLAAVATVAATLGAVRTADKAISGASSLALMSPLADARAQLAGLVFPGFVSAAGITQLRRHPVYVAAITHRVSKLADDLGRDRARMAEMQQATDLFVAAGGVIPLPSDVTEPVRRARWMLEELRISLFAQHLGTSGPVSVQRIAKTLSGK